MLSVICFSKERPLQLQAYLESLLHFSGLKENYISILYKESGDIKYEKLKNKYPDVTWKAETNFNSDLNKMISKAENFILFGCDDVIFKSFFDPNYCIKTLQRDDDIYAFSLRLGTHITGVPNLNVNNRHFEWSWQGIRNPSWNYPWEVSGSIFRKSEVEVYLKHIGSCNNPNYLEDLFYQKVYKNGKILNDLKIPGKLTCFKKSKCMTLTINRVQEEFQNEFDDSLPTDIRSLYENFINGYRIAWESFIDTDNSVIHVNSKYFCLTRDEKPQPVSLIEQEGAFITAIPNISVSLRIKVLFYQYFIPFKEWIRPFVPRKVIQWLRTLVR